MDKLAAMKTFVRIVEAGSLTAAANSLGTSLPTVVRTLSALEHNLGVTLLTRTTRRLSLTDEGSQYFARCRDILAATQEAERSLDLRHTEPVGNISITASVLFGRRYVTPILADFLSRHSKVSADALFVDRVVNLVEEGVDVAIRIGHLKDSSLIAIPVGRVRRIVCASNRYLRRNGTPKFPNDVRRHIFVRHIGLVPRSEWHFRVGNRQVAVPVTSVFTCNDIDGALNACIAGLGLGMFLSYMVVPYIESGHLEYVLEKFETESMPVTVVYPQSRLMPRRARIFIDECVGKLRATTFD